MAKLSSVPNARCRRSAVDRVGLVFGRAASAERPAVENESRLASWLDRYEGRLEQLAAAYHQTSFDRYTGRETSPLGQLDAAFSSLLNEPTAQATVNYWQSRASDPHLTRRLTLLNRLFRETQVSKQPGIYQLRNRLNDRLLAYRPQLNGLEISRNQALEILRTDPNRTTRQTVYQHTLRPLAVELAEPVAELLHQRNVAARNLGYANYPDLHLELTGLDRTSLLTLFARLEQVTRQPYQTGLEEAANRHGLGRVEAWDVQWLTDHPAQLPEAAFKPEMALSQIYTLLAQFGLDGPRLPIRIERQEIPFGGLCFAVRVPTDIRVLCNPRGGFWNFRSLVHEVGHALHYAFNRQASFVLKREGSAFGEGMAETLAYFTHDPDWIRATTGLGATEVEKYQIADRMRRIFRLRNLLAQAHFELAAYDQPTVDLDRLLAEYESHYLLIPLDRTPRWAASSFPVTHPLYRHNYLLADMIAAQTHATLKERFGSFFRQPSPTRATVLTFLQEHYYGPGASLEWRTKVETATGHPLGLDALLEDYKAF